jgi:hypothetical protein
MEEKRQTELGTDSVPRSAGAGQSGLSWGAELCAALKIQLGIAYLSCARPSPTLSGALLPRPGRPVPQTCG